MPQEVSDDEIFVIRLMQQILAVSPTRILDWWFDPNAVRLFDGQMMQLIEPRRLELDSLMLVSSLRALKSAVLSEIAHFGVDYEDTRTFAISSARLAISMVVRYKGGMPIGVFQARPRMFAVIDTLANELWTIAEGGFDYEHDVPF